MWTARNKSLALLLMGGALSYALSACVSTAPKPEATPAASASPVPVSAMPASKASEPITKQIVTAPVPAAGLPEDYQLALNALFANKDAEAERLLVAVTKHHPELAGAYINLGIVRYREGHWDTAIDALRQAVELAPGNAVAHNYLGMSYRHLGRFIEASEAYKQALHADPRYAYAYRNLGILYDLYLRDPKQALDNYRQYQTLANGQDKEVTQWVVELERRMQQEGKAKP